LKFVSVGRGIVDLILCKVILGTISKSSSSGHSHRGKIIESMVATNGISVNRWQKPYAGLELGNFGDLGNEYKNLDLDVFKGLEQIC